MAQNMKMIYTNQGTVGTYTFDINPTTYSHEEISIDNNERTIDAGLVSYNNGIYHLFTLGFQNIGTSQMANIGTIYRTKSPITFYPMDEIRGTNENFSVYITGNYSPKLTDSFWTSGYSLDIILEST